MSGFYVVQRQPRPRFGFYLLKCFSFAANFKYKPMVHQGIAGSRMFFLPFSFLLYPQNTK